MAIFSIFFANADGSGAMNVPTMLFRLWALKTSAGKFFSRMFF
jgi:hypothetical protein